MRLSKAAPKTADINIIRDDIVRLTDRRQQIIDAALDRETAIAAIDTSLDRYEVESANRYSFSIGSLVRPSPNPSVELAKSPDALLAFLVLVGRDKIREVIIDRIDGFYRTNPSMTHEERAKALAEVDRELYQAQAHEEVLARVIERNGHEIIRRADAPPALVLATDAHLQSLVQEAGR
ncbi:MAG: hypothetical protein CTY31_12535 [Hyphomicrobium sp.]|nr:MAG: hypothetical protein CTY31_12535 [Hyphomicrobium sp.]